MSDQVQIKRLRAGEPPMGCPACEQPWSSSPGCLLTEIGVYPDGSTHPRVVVGAATDAAAEFGAIENGYCHDCGANVGQPHHAGCDLEACPRCGGQATSCACWDDNDQ